jgi:hypothetical protein
MGQGKGAAARRLQSEKATGEVNGENILANIWLIEAKTLLLHVPFNNEGTNHINQTSL